MYWILFVMGFIVALVVALLVGGVVTPRTHRVARAVTLRAAPLELWSTVRDVARYAEWRRDLESAVMVDAEQSQVRWRETSTSGSIAFGITSDVPPAYFVARILDDDLALTGEWRWDVEACREGARLRITQHGEIGNPVVRFFSAHVTGHTRAIDRYLQQLTARLGEPAAPIADATPS